MDIRKKNKEWYNSNKKLNKTWQKIINKVFKEYPYRNRFRFNIHFSNIKNNSYYTECIKVSKFDLIKLFFPFKEYSIRILKYNYLIFEIQ